MDPKALPERIDELSRDLGLDEAIRAKLVREAEKFAHQVAVIDSNLSKEVIKLRGQADEARAERDRMAVLQGEIMKLLGSSSQEQIVHDLRNLLNDLTLKKAVEPKKQAHQSGDREAARPKDPGPPRLN